MYHTGKYSTYTHIIKRYLSVQNGSDDMMTHK